MNPPLTKRRLGKQTKMKGKKEIMAVPSQQFPDVVSAGHTEEESEASVVMAAQLLGTREV